MSHHLLIKNNNGNATARQKPLKIFRTDKKQWENQKTRERIAATEPHWRLPSSPIVEKNILKMTAAVIKHDVNHLLIKNNGNATARQKPLKIFRTDKKNNGKIKKLEKESPHLREPGGSRRRQ